MFNKFFISSREAQRVKALNRAKAIVSLEASEGWKHFTELAKEVIESNTPDISTFNSEDAVKIAAQMAFISGIKRCIGLMEQQKDVLASLKKTEDD